MKRSAIPQCANCLCQNLGNSSIAARLIGLCPLLAVSTSLVKALSISLLLIVVGLISTLIACLLRSTIYWRLKPVYFATVASVATVLVVNSLGIYFPFLIDALGIYALLLAANCLVIAKLQEVAEHAPLTVALRGMVQDGLWITIFVMIVGGLREILSKGSIFHDIGLLNNEEIPLAEVGLLPIFADPAGALITVALLLAMIKHFELNLAARKGKKSPTLSASVDG